jgi:hypothetical protein
MSELQAKIIEVMCDTKRPMTTVYGVCARLGNRQERSKDKYYVKVYRAMEKLVDMGKLQVMRGTRDPSVYLNLEIVKTPDEIGKIPF